MLHLLIVFFGSEENFRRTIPESNNFVRVLWIRRIQHTCKAEISYFHVAFVIIKNVGDLEISMDDTLAVKILNAFQYLKHDAFEFL